MNVKLEERDGALVVSPQDSRLDALVAPAFRTTVGDKAQGRATLVLDLARVTFMDSSGLAAVISVLKRLSPGGALRIANAAPAIKTLLQVTRLERVFPVFPGVEEALRGA